MRRVLTSFLATIMSIGCANAATVTNVQGSAQFSSGNGYVRIAVGNEIAPGASVMVGEGGSVRLSYGACFVNFTAPGLYRVPTLEQCQTLASNTTNTIGGTTLTPTELTVGALLIGGGVAGAIALTRSSASP